MPVAIDHRFATPVTSARFPSNNFTKPYIPAPAEASCPAALKGPSVSLKKRLLLNTVVAVPAIWLMIFLPAGTVDYWQGWVFLAVLFGSGALTTIYFLRRDRALLERRARVAEKEPAQKVIVSLLYGLFLATVILSALDHRMHWSADIPPLAILGDALVILGSYVYFLVFRENSFAASTIQVAPDQRVISTGPYAFVRHPLYVGLLIFVTGIPLALGSYWALVLVAPVLPLIVWRLQNEESFLAKHLAGYREYQLKVRWRLIPGLL
jgi:protein-S-isoprenylcysteine O-methyltransferase Ste14